MIKGLLFILVEFGVLWLALWMFQVDRGKPRWWSPFEIRGAGGTGAKHVVGPSRETQSNWRARRRR